MPADARGREQPRAGEKKSSMCLVGKRQAEKKGRQLYFAGIAGQNFLMKTSSCLKKQKQGKAVFPSQGKKKSKQTEILRFCSEKESLVSLLLARQQGLVLISAEKSNDSGLKAGRKKKSPLLPPMLPPFWGAGPSSLPPSATSRLALSAQYQQPPRLENLKAVLGT